LRAMKGYTRQLLEIAIAYVTVLILVDFFLIEYPILTWLALGAAFIFFSIFIVDVLLNLTPKKEVGPTQFELRSEDESTRLERLAKNALDESNPDAARQLSERLASVELRATAYRINMSDAQIADMAKRHPDLLEARLQDEGITLVLNSHGQTVGPPSSRRIHDLLTILESWLP